MKQQQHPLTSHTHGSLTGEVAGRRTQGVKGSSVLDMPYRDLGSLYHSFTDVIALSPTSLSRFLKLILWLFLMKEALTFLFFPVDLVIIACILYNFTH